MSTSYKDCTLNTLDQNFQNQLLGNQWLSDKKIVQIFLTFLTKCLKVDLRWSLHQPAGFLQKSALKHDTFTNQGSSRLTKNESIIIII